MTRDEVQGILNQVQFRDWTLYLGDDKGRMYLQVQWMDEDAVTGKVELQKSRKWMLSPHMVETEIVRTAFLAIRQAALHEVDESFKYQGARIYGPHVSVQALVKAAKHIDVRKPQMV